MEIPGAHVIFYKKLKTRNKKQFISAVLLYKRTQNAPDDPGYWSLFGGKLKKSETPVKAVQREIKEELSIPKHLVNEIKLKCLPAEPKIVDGKKVFIQYYSSLLNLDMDKLRLKWDIEEKKVEGEGLAWFTFEETKSMRIRREDRKAIAKFFMQSSCFFVLIFIYGCSIAPVDGNALYEKYKAEQAGIAVPKNSSNNFLRNLVAGLADVPYPDTSQRRVSLKRLDGKKFIYNNSGNQIGYISDNERPRLDNKKIIYTTVGQSMEYIDDN